MKFKRLASVTLTILFALVISPRSTFASEAADVTAAVHRYLDNLDKDTLETALAMCDSNVSILDEFPPHEWHGPTACADSHRNFGCNVLQRCHPVYSTSEVRDWETATFRSLSRPLAGFPPRLRT